MFMKQLNFTFFFSIFCLALLGQNQTHSVYFATAEHALTELSKTTLNECAAQFSALEDYSIEILAHTDDRGSAAYNKALANRRAASVQEYLATKGVFIKKITVNSFGESNPSFSNTDEEGRRQNRRVDVILKPFSFETMNDVFEQLTAQRRQTFTISPSEIATLKGEKGTIITFPAEVLEFEDGSGAPTKAITIYLEEAYTLGDFIAMNLTTTSHGEMLQTGGTIHLTAFSDGKPLRIKANKSIGLKMPTTEPMTDMELFVGERDTESGNIDWKATKQPFSITSAKKSTRDVFEGETGFEISNALLSKDNYLEQEYKNLYLPSLEGEKRSDPVFRGIVLKTMYSGIISEYSEIRESYPKIKPVKPEPFRLKEPTKPTLEAVRYSPSLATKIRLGKKGIAEKKEKMYERKLKNYEKSLERYELAKTKSVADSAKYQAELVAYKTERLEPWEARRDAFWAQVNKIVVAGSNAAQGDIMLGNTSNNSFLKTKEERLDEIQKADKTGKELSESDLSFYAASIKTFGYMNCDRFMQMSKCLISEVVVRQDWRSGKVLVALPYYKSLLGTEDYRGFLRTTGQITKDTDVKIVGFKVEKGEIFLARLDSQVGTKPIFDLTYKPVSFKELEAVLKQM